MRPPRHPRPKRPPQTSKAKEEPNKSKAKEAPQTSKAKVEPKKSKAKDALQTSKAKEEHQTSKAKGEPQKSLEKEAPQISLDKEVPQESLDKEEPQESLDQEAHNIVAMEQHTEPVASGHKSVTSGQPTPSSSCTGANQESQRKGVEKAGVERKNSSGRTENERRAEGWKWIKGKEKKRAENNKDNTLWCQMEG
ncbi:hypothetical protein NDU88_006709 [Pleurodeles waltl]|uniref:Uncharacterized protein n=1 Tax=Pleurodeles waltl TaxID=8319 RepID=A0AAV7MI61_PLEWA|nr:hypothetical protein NDU88_006709 [Pleurodeles waltl]